MELEFNEKAPKSFFTQYSPPGASVTGTIVSPPVEKELTDFHTGAVKLFPNGDPMKEYHIVIQTQLKDGPDDDGVRSIWVKGWNKARLKEAVLAAGVKKMVVGGTLTVTFVRVENNRSKTHEYVYVPPKDGSAPQAPQQRPAQPAKPPVVRAAEESWESAAPARVAPNRHAAATEALNRLERSNGGRNGTAQKVAAAKAAVAQEEIPF